MIFKSHSNGKTSIELPVVPDGYSWIIFDQKRKNFFREYIALERTTVVDGETFVKRVQTSKLEPHTLDSAYLEAVAGELYNKEFKVFEDYGYPSDGPPNEMRDLLGSYVLEPPRPIFGYYDSSSESMSSDYITEMVAEEYRTESAAYINAGGIIKYEGCYGDNTMMRRTFDLIQTIIDTSPLALEVTFKQDPEEFKKLSPNLPMDQGGELISGFYAYSQGGQALRMFHRAVLTFDFDAKDEPVEWVNLVKMILIALDNANIEEWEYSIFLDK